MAKPSKIISDEIKDVAELADWLREGCTPKEDLLIGTENEKIVFNFHDFEPTPYEGENGIVSILENLRHFGWEPVFEDKNLIGLERNGANISLEPAGQFELSGATFQELHDTASEIDIHLRELEIAMSPLDVGMIGLGYHPTHSPATLPRVPKSRYESLTDIFKMKNLLEAIEMMVCTSTVQVNLGFTSEEDMVKKLRVSLALQPIAVALFANSPFKDGKPSGYQSYRSHVTQNNIDGRYGFMLPVAFEEGFGFERYAEYALNDMPLLGIYQDDHFIGMTGTPFKEFMEGKLDICPGQKATLKDWENHLNCIWPEVRVRRFLEMRGADVGPSEMLKALPAFWVGLLYDDDALDEAYDMIMQWSENDREYLRTMTPLQGLQTPFHGTNVQEIAKDVLKLSEKGLKNRQILNEQGQDETIYLEPLFEIAQSGKNLALRLLDKYENEWKGDIKRLYEEFNYHSGKTFLLPEEEKEHITVVKQDNKLRQILPKIFKW